MISFENVSKHYNDSSNVLSHVSFNLNCGDMAFLTGPSGAGKSTLLRLLSLGSRCSGGDIFLNGQSLIT